MFSKLSRAAFPKHKLITSTNPHGAIQREPRDYSYVRRLAYLPGCNLVASGAMAVGYETESGLHACRAAHMVIVDDLGRLHSEEADLEWVLHLLYIVARGIPLTTEAVALSSKGDMRKIPTTSVREHKPQMNRRLLFLVTKKLNAECPALATGIRAIEQMKSSAWRVKLVDEIAVAAQSVGATAASGASRNTPSNGASSTTRRPKASAKKTAIKKNRDGRPVGSTLAA